MLNTFIERLSVVRRNIQKNLPCGSETFIEQLEQLARRVLRFRPVGRPKSSVSFLPTSEENV
jgi:hypothetical protein